MSINILSELTADDGEVMALDKLCQIKMGNCQISKYEITPRKKAMTNGETVQEIMKDNKDQDS